MFSSSQLFNNWAVPNSEEGNCETRTFMLIQTNRCSLVNTLVLDFLFFLVFYVPINHWWRVLWYSFMIRISALCLNKCPSVGVYEWVACHNQKPDRVCNWRACMGICSWSWTLLISVCMWCECGRSSVTWLAVGCVSTWSQTVSCIGPFSHLTL